MEVITVIGLLGMVALIIANNMVGIQGREKETEYESYKMQVESAACTYIEKLIYSEQKSACKNNPNSASCKITIGTLIDEGLIDEELYNPKEGVEVKELRSNFVLVSYPNMEKTCTLQE